MDLGHSVEPWAVGGVGVVSLVAFPLNRAAVKGRLCCLLSTERPSPKREKRVRPAPLIFGSDGAACSEYGNNRTVKRAVAVFHVSLLRWVIPSAGFLRPAVTVAGQEILQNGSAVN